MDNRNVKAALVASSILAASQAQAAIPAEVTTMYTDLGADVVSYGALAFTAVIAVLGITVGIKLTKKFVSRAF